MSVSSRKILLAIAVLLVAGFLGWFLGRDAGSAARTPQREARGASGPTRSSTPYDAPNADSKGARERRVASDDEEPGAIPNERLVHFKTEEAYRKFLASLEGSGIRLLGQLDALRTLRLGYDEYGDLLDLLGDDSDQYANFPVYVPEPPEDGVGFGGTGFGANVLEWLGISGDNSQFGSGVRIAVVDTGVSSHRSLGSVEQIDLLTAIRGQLVELNPHGTSVASLIAGLEGEFAGVAPGAELISVRIGDETGAANSFLLAQGIVSAVDAGAQLINVSMGSEGNSGIVEMAIAYALENGALIIASAGNSGHETLSYPAANEGVIAVGAVDAGGTQLGFSNSGDSLSALAPGLEIYAAAGDGYVLFSGTSASAPLLTGAIAATASEMGIPLADAYALIVNNLNEAGAPGPDPFYGDGILNMNRVLNSNTAGIYDAALASTYYDPASETSPVDRLLFTVENRGTATISGIELDVTTNYGQTPYNIGTLAPNQIATVALPIGTASDNFSVQAEVRIPGNITDVNPGNDSATGQLTVIQQATQALEELSQGAAGSQLTDEQRTELIRRIGESEAR